MKYDVFISYSRKDFDEVSRLIEIIRNNIPDIRIWFDLDSIDSGEEQFDNKIVEALDNSSYFILALSDNSKNSEWVKDEMVYAQNVGCKIVLILLNGARLTGWALLKLGRMSCVDSTNKLQFNKFLSNLSKWTGKSMVSQSPCPKSDDKDVLALSTESLPVCDSAEIKQWKVGDYYCVGGKEGVVFWVDSEKRHGKIISLDECELQWSVPDIYKWRHYPLTGTKDKRKGNINHKIVMKTSNWRERHPAFVWCADHGADWYLPAIDEVKRFLLNKSVFKSVNKTLMELGAHQLVSKKSWEVYWSSTENAEKSAWGVDVDYGEEICLDVTLRYRVRAVSAF